MDKLDKLIKEALENEDAVIIGDPERMGYFALGLKQFSGNMGWVTWVIMIVQTVMFIVSVWMAFKFFAATDLLIALKWGLSSAVLMIMGLNLKLSLVPQMQADRVIEEIKRAELILLSRKG